jgi:hypothetical protein
MSKAIEWLFYILMFWGIFLLSTLINAELGLNFYLSLTNISLKLCQRGMIKMTNMKAYSQKKLIKHRIWFGGRKKREQKIFCYYNVHFISVTICINY